MDSQPIETTQRSQKHVWTTEEDDLLVACLVDLKVDGRYVAENGFRPGYLQQLETMMHERSPSCTLKAVPHIQSRIKTLKSLWQTVYDMVNGVNTSGFGWDPVTKMVVAEKPVWDEYCKTHKKAAIFQLKTFPYYDQLLIAFGKDRATGATSQDAGDLLEEINENPTAENDGLDDFEDEDDMSTFNPELQPQVQLPNQSAEGGSASRKRKRASSGKDDSIVDGMKDACSIIAAQFSEATTNLAGTMKLLADKQKQETKAQAQASTLWTEMRNIQGLTQHEMYDGYNKIINNEMYLAGFKDIPVEERADWIRYLIS